MLALDTHFKTFSFLKSIFILCLVFSLSCYNLKETAGLYPSSNLKIRGQSDWAKNRYFERIDDFKKKPIGYNKIVFLGNSITKGGGDWNKRLNVSNIINRGISGDISEGVLERLDEIIHYKPIAVFLLIGFNNFFTDFNSDPTITPEYIYNNIINIGKIITEESPKTKVYLQTILPMDNKKYINTTAEYSFLLPTYQPSINNQITKVNSLLMNNNEFEVIDLHSAFKNQNGLLKENLSHDGVHLNEIGYSVWAEKLKPYIIKINK